MVRRYKEEIVPDDIGERIALIRENNDRHTIIRDKSNLFRISGVIHYVPASAKTYFLVDWKDGGERLPLRYMKIWLVWK